jgi:hypothetical protein
LKNTFRWFFFHRTLKMRGPSCKKNLKIWLKFLHFYHTHPINTHISHPNLTKHIPLSLHIPTNKKQTIDTGFGWILVKSEVQRRNWSCRIIWTAHLTPRVTECSVCETANLSWGSTSNPMTQVRETLGAVTSSTRYDDPTGRLQICLCSIMKPITACLVTVSLSRIAAWLKQVVIEEG